jgi:hypothetical protein
LQVLARCQLLTCVSLLKQDCHSTRAGQHALLTSLVLSPFTLQVCTCSSSSSREQHVSADF